MRDSKDSQKMRHVCHPDKEKGAGGRDFKGKESRKMKRVNVW